MKENNEKVTTLLNGARAMKFHDPLIPLELEQTVRTPVSDVYRKMLT
jgi:hypothetical protein